MKLDVITATSVARGVNKAMLTGNFSLLAVAKLSMLARYSELVKEDVEKYKIFTRRINKFINNNPLTICNILESSCATGEYITSKEVRNPYKPLAPITAPEPEPEPSNLPASIDDHTITVDENLTTVLDINMFLGIYSDPENDALDAIRIDKIHSTNTGLFYLDGVEIYKGLIITRQQIEQELLVHIGTEVTDVQTDSFDFSARDEVNGTWVN